VHVFVTHSIHHCYSYCTATTGQIAKQVDLLAHCAADRDPRVDKGSRSLTTGEKRRPIHIGGHPHAIVVVVVVVLSDLHCNLQDLRDIGLLLSSAEETTRKPTLDPVARRNGTGIGTRCPPSRLPTNCHPLRSNSQDSGLARTYLLYPALCFLFSESERDRERRHDCTRTTLIPNIYLREETRILSCRYQLHLSRFADITNTRKRRSIFSQNKLTDKPQKDDAWKRQSWKCKGEHRRVSSAGQRHCT
jgi:hypothetical protein